LGNYNITSNTALFTIGKATPMITWTTPAAITYGIALSETQLNANSDVPGTFTFMPAAGTALNAGANQTLSTTFTPTDTTDYTTQTASVTITVNQASSSIAFTSSQNPSMVGISVTFTATVSSPRGTPTGTVTFNNGNSSLGTAPLASGQTAFSASMLALGTHSITAVYSGDTNFLSSTSSALSQMVTPLTGATGPLRALASNPRYFTDGSGKAILLSGSHTWNDFQDMDQSSSPAAFDFNGYVNFLKVHGNNVTILWKKDLPTFCNWGAGGTWHVVQFPWQRTGSTNASDGLPAFDLANFDQSYFDRLRARVLQLQQNGIYAIVQLFDGLQLTDNRCAGDGYPFSAGNNVNNVDDGGGTGSMTMTAPNAITDFQDTYVKRVIDTLNDLPNVLWEVSEEAPINSGSWWQGHMIDLIHSYESTQSMQHPVGFPTLDINNGSQDSTLYNSKADWVAPKARISPTSSCGTLGTPLCKVDINDSDHSYFGMWKDNVQANRNYLWENFVNGNGVIFMDPYSVFWSTDNRNLCRNPVNGVCDAPDTRWDNLRDNMGKGIVSYANRMNLAAMSPHPELSSTGFALANPGVEYLVYEPGSPSTFTVSLVPATYIYEWFNPSSLTVASTGTITVSAPGNQPFTQPFSGDAVLYLVAIAAADTQPPSAPGSLTLNAVSATQLNLSWTASTDNVGVTGYLVERCQDAGCTNFAQVATPSASVTAYSDTGILSNTTYAYRIRATDAAANFSAYSNVASASTLAVVAIAPGTATLTLILTQQFSVSGSGLTWSVDGVAGGSAATGTITTTGLYTPTLGSVGAHTVTASSATPPQIGNATVYVTNYPGTYTRDIDKLRTGLNPSETVLTPNNVRVAQFGKLFSYAIDGTADASSLYVPNVNIPGKGPHNVVYVATEHDSVYAFDADGRQPDPLWHVTFINGTTVTTVPPNDTNECCDISPEIGITGSPVIDPTTNTLYVVSKRKEFQDTGIYWFHHLHALDLATGTEKFGGPKEIEASVPGDGDGAFNGVIRFQPLHQNQRAALLLDNGIVYIAFGAHGDNRPYHGWILGYDASTLEQVMVFNTSPNDPGNRGSTGGGEGSGVWQSGDGLATDSTHDIYFVTGNGLFDADQGGWDFGDSFLKISPSGLLLDYFTPHDQQLMNDDDIDLGSGGVLLLPDQPGPHPHLAITAGKNGTIYLVDRDNLGHYNPLNDNQIVQSIVNIFPHHNLSTGNFKAPVYWNGRLFFSADADNLKSFTLNNGLMSISPTSVSSLFLNYPGATLGVSSNGNANAILWAVQRVDYDPEGGGVQGPGSLHAFDATDLTKELYNSNQASGARDALDFTAKWSAPLVANGKVFVATNGQLAAFGLLP
ncbi:MAG: hypothetical protein DMG62_17695, partial [Acidobacteria bacterium]